MKSLSHVLQEALLILEEKYYQRKTMVWTGKDAPPLVYPPAPPVSQTDVQREVLRRFMHFRG